MEENLSQYDPGSGTGSKTPTLTFPSLQQRLHGANLIESFLFLHKKKQLITHPRPFIIYLTFIHLALNSVVVDFDPVHDNMWKSLKTSPDIT